MKKCVLIPSSSGQGFKSIINVEVNMHNTSLSGLLRGAQSRHDDCGISWKSHELPNNKTGGGIPINFDEYYFSKQIQSCLAGIAADMRSIPELRSASQSHIVKWGSPPFQYRNPRIYGPVADQDEMDQRKEWLDTIARESERLGLD